MRKSLAEYAKEGGYEDEQGNWHEDAESLLQTGILGFCGCGRGQDSLLYLLRGLELIEEQPPSERSEQEAWYAANRARMEEHFKTSGARYFFFYWCDKEGLTEHGGSVPGWLDEKGKALLSMLREWHDSQQEPKASTPPQPV